MASTRNPGRSRFAQINMRLSLSIILAVALGVIVGQSQTSKAPPSVPAANSATASEIRVIDLDGLKKLLQRDANQPRPLLVNFWASWCDGCREEFPDLVKIDDDYRSKGLNFIAVSLDDVTDINTKVTGFLKEVHAGMPVVVLNVNDPEPAIHF